MDPDMAFALLADSHMRGISTNKPPRWSCQDCGMRVRNWHGPPATWTRVSSPLDGFIAYRCESCEERKAIRRAKIENMAAVRKHRAEQEALKILVASGSEPVLRRPAGTYKKKATPV